MGDVVGTESDQTQFGRRRTARREASSADTETSRAATVRGSYRLTLLGRFLLEDAGGREVSVPHDGARLLSYVALAGGQEVRLRIVAVLWPDDAYAHGAKRLRTVLWRIRRIAPAVLAVDGRRVRLSPDVVVDLASATALAVQLADGVVDVDALSGSLVVANLSQDLLPGWDEEWLAVHAEAWRQTRVHALQAVAAGFAAAGCFAEATTAALAAVDADPLCESSHETLMRVHAAAGNPVRAVLQYGAYVDLLRREVHMAPSDDLQQLAEGYTHGE